MRIFRQNNDFSENPSNSESRGGHSPLPPGHEAPASGFEAANWSSIPAKSGSLHLGSTLVERNFLLSAFALLICFVKTRPGWQSGDRHPGPV